jgi:hypothetical protein
VLLVPAALHRYTEFWWQKVAFGVHTSGTQRPELQTVPG